MKISIANGKVLLILHNAQGGNRIADESGNHEGSPTKTKNEDKFFVEWMITNMEIKALSSSFLNSDDIKMLTEQLKSLHQFVNESEYSKRKTIKSTTEKMEDFLGFEVSKYTDNFYSFEKTLRSRIKVRLTFKTGSYGIEPHPHMYVLLPFNHASIKIKNNEGDVSKGNVLGSGCFCEWTPEKEDIRETILTLAHASNDHRNALITILNS